MVETEELHRTIRLIKGRFEIVVHEDGIVEIVAGDHDYLLQLTKKEFDDLVHSRTYFMINWRGQ